MPATVCCLAVPAFALAMPACELAGYIECLCDLLDGGDVLERGHSNARFFAGGICTAPVVVDVCLTGLFIASPVVTSGICACQSRYDPVPLPKDQPLATEKNRVGW
ncbi:hypothetical protein D3C72_1154980 [compost metagenome]